MVGLPDDYWSEVVTAFVILRPEPSAADDLRRATAGNQIACYKTPKAVHVVDELPVDPQGKVLKRELRRVSRWRPVPGARPAADASPPSRSSTPAAALFAREGYHAVGTRDIADELGIRGASLYHHYSVQGGDPLRRSAGGSPPSPSSRPCRCSTTPARPAPRLAALVRAHLHHLVRRRVEFLVGLQELAALTPEHRAEVERAPPVLPAPGPRHRRGRGARG